MNRKSWNKKYKHLFDEELVFSQNQNSEHGEEGIIKSVFSKKKPTNKFCVDIGAADGVRSSNTRALLEDSWQSLQIEGDPVQAYSCAANCGGFEATTICQMVTPFNVNKLLDLYKVPQQFGFLSIDTDSFEYEIWKNLTFKPNLVCIEVNQFETDPKVIDYDPSFSLWRYRNQREGYGGTTLGLANKLAEEKGYDFLCLDVSNAFYIDKEWANGR